MEEQYYQQNIPVSPNELYAQEMIENKMNNILAQISPSVQIEEIEMRIKGYKKDIYSKQWEEKPSINTSIPDIMIERYISWLSSFMSINVIMGNLSARQITRIMMICVEWIVDDIDSHSEEYGFFSDSTEKTRVGDMLLFNTFFVLNRSLDGSEAKRFWKSFSLSENSQSNPNQNKGDWWKFWKK